MDLCHYSSMCHGELLYAVAKHLMQKCLCVMLVFAKCNKIVTKYTIVFTIIADNDTSAVLQTIHTDTHACKV